MTAEYQSPLAKMPSGKPSINDSVKYAAPIQARTGNPIDLHVVDANADTTDRHAHFPISSRSKTNFDSGTASKRTLDIVGGIILGLLFLPLTVIAALLIRREGEPVIYRHQRVGKNGLMFDCLKFRTMVPNAEEALKDLLKQHPELREEWLKNHKLRDDPRITAIGRFLRKTSLDELPQLWNVLCGDMSLVGPRPVTKDELGRYGRSVSTYLAAKPGLTGLWQVSRCSDTTYRRRVAMDVYYLRNRNLALDMYILAATASVILGKGDCAY